MTLPQPPLPALAETALFVDFDGTLVEIAPTPEAVIVAPGLLELLERLHDDLGGALAIVSGRPVEQLDHLLAAHRFTVAGLHGLDLRLRDGRRHRPESAAAALARIRPELDSFAAEHPGVLIEDKGLTLALHYRAVPAAADAVRAAAGRALASLGDAFVALDGKMVVELKPKGVDKGLAIRRLLEDSPFAGRRPVFLGDDVTDEAGFAAMDDLGGTGIVVDAAGRPSAARFALADVAAVHAWLGTLGGRRS